MRLGPWALLWLLLPSLAGAAAEPCRGGRFLVEGGPLLDGLHGAPEAVVLAAAGRVAIASGCEVTPAKVRSNRKGTRIAATWPTCGTHVAVRLRARVVGPACDVMKGTLRAAGRGRRRFVATRQVCAPGESILRCGRFLGFAHRGGADVRPENTMAAYQNAVDLEADVLEGDLHATSDGVVVLLHDDRVDRTTDGSGLVWEKTFAELQALDAGYRFTPDGGVTFPYRGQGVRIPSLAELLAAFPAKHFSLEIKQSSPPIVDLVVATLRAAGAEDRVVVPSFDPAVVAEVQQQAPEILTSMGLGDTLAFAQLTPAGEAGYVPPAPTIQAPVGLGAVPFVTASYVARAERFGLGLHVWTVDDRPAMDALLMLGVHGIMSNDPALLVSAIRAAGVDSGVRQ